MKYYIGKSGGTGRKFDNLQDFLDAIKDLAETYDSFGEDWFEIEVVN